MKRILPLLALCTLLASCTVSKNDFLAMQNRVNAQDQQIQSMQQNLADQWSELESLRARVGQLEGKQQELNSRFTAPPPGSLTPSLPETPSSLDRAGMSADEARELNAEIPNEAMAPGQQGQELYNMALDQFKATNYEAAKATWEEFILANPNHALIPNALFWQGECHYQRQEYPQAILLYQQVIEKYPNSTKYAAAMLKQGVSFITIGKNQAGALVLNDVIKKFPNSPEAERAREFLRGVQ